MDAYRELLAHRREAHLLESTAELLSWDQETMMPPGGVEHRAEQLALLASLAHERLTGPRYADLVAASRELAATDELAVDERTNIRELARDFVRRVRLPADLVQRSAELTSRAQHAWASARADSDFESFAPWLEQMVSLARERADHLVDVTPDATERWDALAEDYEQGMRAAALEGVFGPLRTELSTMARELATGSVPSDEFVREVVPVEQQESFVRAVAEAMGFDFERGRLDRSAHPFCGGSHGGDVRITTRFHADNLLDALGSTMHESGHGLYEQGLRADAVGLPTGTAVSLGIHESQSRLWENHVGRSRAFWAWASPLLHEHVEPTIARRYDADTLFGAANIVRPSLIRVEADEVTYHLHVIVRFDLERALICGDLAARDLPAAWNEAYRDLLGIDVPDDARGCLQDVHWSCGLFGYFPTYTLGSVYAAQFFDAAERSLPDLEGDLARGSSPRSVSGFAPTCTKPECATHPRSFVGRRPGKGWIPRL